MSALDDKIRRENDALRQFANDILEWWPGGDVDGGYLQDTAVRHGLLREETRTEPCDDETHVCQCRELVGEFPVLCYRRTELLSTSASLDNDMKI